MLTARPLLTAAAATALLLTAGCDQPKPREVPPAAPEAPAAPTEAGPGALSVGLPKRPEFPGFYLDHAGQITDPLNNPAGVTPAGQPLLLDGFGFDAPAKVPAKGVDVVLDGKAYGTAYGAARPDVAAFNKVPGLVPVGFRLVLPADAVKAGPHTVYVRVIAADGSGYFESPPVIFEVK